MPFENEDIQQDANLEVSSEPQVESSEVESSPVSDESTESKAQSVPFHEDPRMQDYIERQVAKRAEAYEARMAELQRQIEQASRPKESQEVHPWKAKLKEIDPQYAKYFDDIEAKAGRVENIEAELAQIKQERILGQYESAVSAAQSEAKISPEIHTRVKRELDALAAAGRIGLKDVPAKYKELATDYNQFLESVKRSERASYVQEKSKDVKAPATQAKGKMPSRDDKGRFAGMDREEMNSQIAKLAAKRLRSGSDI